MTDHFTYITRDYDICISYKPNNDKYLSLAWKDLRFTLVKGTVPAEKKACAEII